MEFLSIDEIKEKLKIKDEDPDQIRKELKKRLSKIHPDRHGDKFPSKEAEKDWHQIVAAIDFIDGITAKDKELIHIKQVNTLIKTLTDLVVSQDSSKGVSNLELKLDRKIDRNIKNVKKDLILPKITLSTLTIFTTFIWAFPETINKHPILSKHIDVTSSLFIDAWSSLIFFTVVFWLVCLFLEGKKKNLIKKLGLESCQEMLFHEFLTSEDVFQMETFQKEDFIDYLSKKFNKKRKSFRKIFPYIPIPDSFDSELGQSIADILFQRALNKGMIEKGEIKSSLSDWYSINPEVVDEL